MKYHPFALFYPSFVFLFTTYAVMIVESPNTCAIQAWVRAPDLDPGGVIPGQARIEVKGPCNPIAEYSLILRFKERTRTRVLKPGVALPERPPRLFGGNFLDEILGVASQNPMEDPTLWVIVEEERVAFETKYKLSDGPIQQPEFQSIHDFSLLVPTTNYPPASFMPERGNEHNYVYTVEVKFVNGTTIEVPAGRSSFNTVSPNSQINATSEVVSFAANFKEISTGLPHPWIPLDISFNLDVTFPHGRHLEQDSELNLTFTINGEPQIDPGTDRANYSIVLGPPSLDLIPTSRHRRMDTLFPGMDVPEAPPAHLNRFQLSATSDDAECSELYVRTAHPVTVKEPHWNKTISQSYKIHKFALPSFDMYYQSIEAQIEITLTLQYVQTPDPLLAREDYAWIPTIPAVTRLENSKFFQNFQAKIPVTVYPRARKPDYQVTHYLSSEARHPVFVDPLKAGELSRLSVQERDRLAPKSEPFINKCGDGVDEVVRARYSNIHNPLHYVGDTWQRKVLSSGEMTFQK